jgi:hypothetical protein
MVSISTDLFSVSICNILAPVAGCSAKDYYYGKQKELLKIEFLL